MRHAFLTALTCCSIVGFAMAAGTPQKAATPQKKTAAAAPKKGTTAASSAKPASHTASRPATRATSSRSRYRQPARRYSVLQNSPTPERYKEIQDALAAKGYLKAPVTGVWDKDSVDAMQKFQQDQNLEPTGKLTARSLSALGLGPKPPEIPTAPSSPPETLSANPAPDGSPIQ